MRSSQRPHCVVTKNSGSVSGSVLACHPKWQDILIPGLLLAKHLEPKSQLIMEVRPIGWICGQVLKNFSGRRMTNLTVNWDVGMGTTGDKSPGFPCIPSHPGGGPCSILLWMSQAVSANFSFS